MEASTQQTIKDEAQPQKRHIGLGALSDCDGPSGVVAGLHAGLHSDVAVHGDLGLGLHGHGYAPAYGSGYLGSGFLGSGALLSPAGAIGHIGTVGHVGAIGGHIGHIGGLGAIVAAPQVVSGGYAPHAPVLASSIVSHAPVVAPTVRNFILKPQNCIRRNFFHKSKQYFRKKLKKNPNNRFKSFSITDHSSCTIGN